MITVGTLEPSDRSAWEELFAGYNAFYGRDSMPTGFYDRAWSEFSAGERIHALGARLDRELVGIAHYFVHPSTTSADLCYLQDLFTAPEVRGRGVARTLIEAVTEWSRDRGCARLYWHTKDTNATARRLYDQVATYDGFIVYGVKL